jgi:hypothetical protein
MLCSFRAREPRVGVVGHLQTGRIREVRKDVWMGQGVDHWIVTHAVKDRDGRNFAVAQDVMEALGETRSIHVFPAFDSAESCSRIDRALFVRGARACHSLDGQTSTWRYNPDDDGNHQTPLPPAMAELVLSRNGVSAQVRCREDSCPLVTDPIVTGRTTWPCKPRGTFLFRLGAATHSGIYAYKTTSLPSTEAVYAMLAYLERVTMRNMAMVPLVLVMTQAKPRHGRTVNRVNLQIASTLPQMVEHALVWKRQKAELGVELDAEAAFEEADDDEADAAMYQPGDGQETASDAPEAPAEPSDQPQDKATDTPPADEPKPYHLDVKRAMGEALNAKRWTTAEINGLLQVLDVERITAAEPEKCQVMIEAMQDHGPAWLQRYDKTGEVGQPALDQSSDKAQPSPPYYDDDIPF